MAAPSEYLDWNPSLSHVIDPPSGLKSAGYLPTEVPDSQHHNWIFNLVDQWIKYLNGQISLTQITVTTTYSVAAGVRTVLANVTGGSFAITLLPASSYSAGARITVKNITFGSANVANVTPNGGDLIEGVNALTALGAGEYITLETDGASSWYQVG